MLLRAKYVIGLSFPPSLLVSLFQMCSELILLINLVCFQVVYQKNWSFVCTIDLTLKSMVCTVFIIWFNRL